MISIVTITKRNQQDILAQEILNINSASDTIKVLSEINSEGGNLEVSFERLENTLDHTVDKLEDMLDEKKFKRILLKKINLDDTELSKFNNLLSHIEKRQIQTLLNFKIQA